MPLAVWSEARCSAEPTTSSADSTPEIGDRAHWCTMVPESLTEADELVHP